MISPSHGFHSLTQLGLQLEPQLDQIVRVAPVCLPTVTIPQPFLTYGLANAADLQQNSFIATVQRDQGASTAAATVTLTRFAAGLWRLVLTMAGQTDFTPTLNDTGYVDLVLSDGSVDLDVFRTLPAANIPFHHQATIEIYTLAPLNLLQLAVPATGVGETFSTSASCMAFRIL